ncbi:MAG: protein-L-isoaspartate(D-aspartate) O-methyltransferase [Ottowia sp.]|nr:protein-L-isoaspartate(D-aspartate) O-methyltransferase [Ottowia sp.]
MTRKTFPLSLDKVLDSGKKIMPAAHARSHPFSTRNAGSLSKALPIKKKEGSPAFTTTVMASHKCGPFSASEMPMVSGLGLDSARARLALVQRLREQGMHDETVLDAIARVPRHLFVDAGLASQAYEDTALPIGYEQTISKPSVVSRMIALLRQYDAPQARFARVLEIGTGCGYQAAVLSFVAREVYSIERIKPLFEKAKTHLRPLRLPNVRLHYGDGMLGLPKEAPFDAIILAAAGVLVPPALLDQLAMGGKLIAPVVSAQGQRLKMTVRQAESVFYEMEFEDVLFVPLKSGII